jgi:hypothetical protein
MCPHQLLPSNDNELSCANAGTRRMIDKNNHDFLNVVPPNKQPWDNDPDEPLNVAKSSQAVVDYLL